MGARVVNMKKYDFNRLKEENFLLIVVSTHGQGEPPQEAKQFYRQLFASDAPLLNNLRFAVCALGDSSYDFFCQTGREIDERLKELGATRFCERAECDVEFRKAAAAWISGVMGKYRSSNGKEVSPLNIRKKKTNESIGATIKSRRLLNEGSEAGVYHLELFVDDARLNYLPGDSVSIVPQNPENLVNELIKKLGGKSSTMVRYLEKEYSLGELLRNHFEITILSKGLLERYRELSRNIDLEQLLGKEKELREYLKNHDLLDLLSDFPGNLNPGELVSVLRKIQPRLYSLASSLKYNQEEVHLTVKQVCLTADGRTRPGACSSYLTQRLQPGSKLTLEVAANHEFRLPEDGSPVIMVAAGTGIAPFRAFLQELEAAEAGNYSWFLFGEKQQKHDFLYRDEWYNWLNRKILHRLDVAFSRDFHEKVYVQDKIKEQAALFYEWIQNKAHVYVCGSVKMGQAVRQAAAEAIQKAGNMSHNEAVDFIDKMEDENRWNEDLY